MAPKRPTAIIVIHAVHLQPRLLSITMNDPTTGPATGPVKAPAAKIQIAYALGMGSHRSDMAPPTMASGAEDAKPPRKRPTIMVVTFFASATGIWKRPKIK